MANTYFKKTTFQFGREFFYSGLSYLITTVRARGFEASLRKRFWQDYITVQSDLTCEMITQEQRT